MSATNVMVAPKQMATMPIDRKSIPASLPKSEPLKGHRESASASKVFLADAV